MWILPFTIDTYTYTPDGVNVREEFTDHAIFAAVLIYLE
jgi:hypothetical protein